MKVTRFIHLCVHAILVAVVVLLKTAKPAPSDVPAIEDNAKHSHTKPDEDDEAVLFLQLLINPTPKCRTGHRNGTIPRTSPACPPAVGSNLVEGRAFAGPIDFVYCWAGEEAEENVDSDLMANTTVQHVSGHHFNEMQSSLRSLQLHAPWFNKVYLLVNGPAQLPTWAANDSRIEMVDRCTLFPVRSDCPTKNTAACQAVSHLIPGLSEHFVAMQDDYFFVGPVTPSSFFDADGAPFIFALGTGVLTPVYGPREELSGPDVPPEKVPLRTSPFVHSPIPMLVSFTRTLEEEFGDWFAFVRSHKRRFVCCNATLYGNGLDEDFSRVYPAMLHERHVGVNLELAHKAAMIGYCHCGDIQCIRVLLEIPATKFLNIQSCKTIVEWREARHLLDQRPEHFEGLRGELVSVSLATLAGTEHVGTDLVVSAITLLDIVLAAASFWVIGSSLHTTRSRPAGFLGLETFQQVAIFVSYIALSVAHLFLQQRAGKSGYSIISATILIYFIKIVVSFVMFLCRGDLTAGFSTLSAPGCARFGKVPACILPMVPGGLLATYDALSFLSLVNMDPVTYKIFVHMRLVLLGFLWQWAFQQKLSAPQWLALLLFVAASITKGVEQVTGTDTGFRIGIIIVSIQIVVGAVASVASEVLLKEMPMPIDLVNTCTYFWGLVVIANMMLMSQGPAALYSELLSPAAWNKLLVDPYMIGSIVCLAAIGVVTAYLIKGLSNIVKELSGGFVIIITTILQWLFAGVSIINGFSMMGVIVALFGIGVYSTDPLSNPKPQKQDAIIPPAPFEGRLTNPPPSPPP